MKLCPPIYSWPPIYWPLLIGALAQGPFCGEDCGEDCGEYEIHVDVRRNGGESEDKGNLRKAPGHGV
jgi:hypothetical protein